ncbi:MAG: L-threonylcarbamoyladenylate synthase [Bacteriovoracaceae bacterium]
MNIELSQAIAIVKSGDVVGMPTETVYGLAGSISSEAALKKIFAVKERPFFDPLIVHIAEFSDVLKVAKSFPPVAQSLAKMIWPGPLTLILPKRDDLNPLITSGLGEVGIRMPRHPLALELIKACGPLAAPSANKFKKTSPSLAQHVRDEFGDSVFVLDGGQCEVGIESTVVGFSEGKVLIYRPGGIDLSKLQLLLNAFSVVVEYAESPVAPGQMQHHYMPKIPLFVLYPGDLVDAAFLQPKELVLNIDPSLAARELYFKMRQISDSGADAIYVYRMPEHYSHEWRGVWDRLLKAAVK